MAKKKTPKMTQADRVAIAMGDDGQKWTAPCGHSLDHMCDSWGGTRTQIDHETLEWRFSDGSAIVACEAAWDTEAGWEASR